MVQAWIQANAAGSDISVYTDEKKDIPMLSIGNHMIAVNADAETKEFALLHGGIVKEFA